MKSEAVVVLYLSVFSPAALGVSVAESGVAPGDVGKQGFTVG